jgi:hypothetical protein
LLKIGLAKRIHQFFTGLEKLLGQEFWHKNRRLSDVERWFVIGGPVNFFQEGLVFFFGKSGVVGFADGRNHGRIVFVFVFKIIVEAISTFLTNGGQFDIN